MSRLSVKVGDKGTYRGNLEPCEVIFVKPSGGYFVTSSNAFVPQVHSSSGTNLNHRDSAWFDFIPEPRGIRVAVWLDSFGNVYNSKLDSVAPPTANVKYVTFEVPR